EPRVRAHRPCRAGDPQPGRRRAAAVRAGTAVCDDLRAVERAVQRSAVMLLLPAATEPFSGPMLALVSTLAGNLLIVGSIANIIVLDAARRRGILIDWRQHARTGVPVTVATLAITAGWFMLSA